MGWFNRCSSSRIRSQMAAGGTERETSSRRRYGGRQRRRTLTLPCTGTPWRTPSLSRSRGQLWGGGQHRRSEASMRQFPGAALDKRVRLIVFTSPPRRKKNGRAGGRAAYTSSIRYCTSNFVHFRTSIQYVCLTQNRVVTKEFKENMNTMKEVNLQMVQKAENHQRYQLQKKPWTMSVCRIFLRFANVFRKNLSKTNECSELLLQAATISGYGLERFAILCTIHDRLVDLSKGYDSTRNEGKLTFYIIYHRVRRSVLTGAKVHT